MVDLSEEDFDVMCGMVSWATCGSGKNRDWIPEDSTNNYEKNFNNRLFFFNNYNNVMPTVLVIGMRI